MLMNGAALAWHEKFLGAPPSVSLDCSSAEANALRNGRMPDRRATATRLRGNLFGVSSQVNALHALRVEPAPQTNPQPALRDYVAKAVRRYLLDLGDCDSHELYDIVLREIEVPMLAEVMRHCEGNQSRAAATQIGRAHV